MLYKKKRYAGLCYESLDKDPKLDIKVSNRAPNITCAHYTIVAKLCVLCAQGLELVRRDNCELIRDTQREVLNTLLKHRDINMARSQIHSVVQDVLNGKVSTKKLIISKTLNRVSIWLRMLFSLARSVT